MTLTPEVDGRTVRRDRNRDAVLDAVLALFSEDNLEPTPEQVARRSGVSLRSVYRYFSDRDELVRAAVELHAAKAEPLFAIAPVDRDTIDGRIAAFLAARLRGYEAIAATARAARLRAPTSPIIRARLERGRRRLRQQFEEQFAPDLAAFDAATRRALLAAGDTLTQIESIDLYRVHHRYSRAETLKLLTVALRSLLTS